MSSSTLTLLSCLLGRALGQSPALLSVFIYLLALLLARTTQYLYNGSLTTPPCSESVQWVVFDQPVTISRDDLRLIRGAIGALPHTYVSDAGNNNR